jgi:hypothetical protein
MVWGNLTRREAILVVDLQSPVEIPGPMYEPTWWAGGEPTFTLLVGPETYDADIAPAKKIVTPSYRDSPPRPG